MDCEAFCGWTRQLRMRNDPCQSPIFAVESFLSAMLTRAIIKDIALGQ